MRQRHLQLLWRRAETSLDALFLWSRWGLRFPSTVTHGLRRGLRSFAVPRLLVTNFDDQYRKYPTIRE
jgi:hypothetical protein